MVASAVFIGVKDVAGDERDAHVVGPADKVLAVHPVRQPAPDVDAAERLIILHAQRLKLVELAADEVALAAVILAKGGKRAIVAAVVKIHAEELLRQPVRGHQSHGDKIAHRADKIAVARDKGKAQPRNECEREGIDVNDVAHRVEGLDRRELFPLVGKLARRVLLHDRNAVAVGKLDELFAPLDRQNASRGVVIARIDEDEARPCMREQVFKHRAVHAVFIHRHGEDLCAGKLHHAVHIGVHGLFHHHAVAGVDKEGDDKIERLVRFRQHLNFARGRLHTLGCKEGYELLPQGTVALVGAEKVLARAAARDERGNIPRHALG